MNEIEVLDKILEKVIIPLKQHGGVICDPVVSAGDRVLVGQKIGECSANYCSCVHSSVAGEVTSIAKAPNPGGNRVESVIIKPDENQESVDFVPSGASSSQEIISAIKEAGIVEHFGTPTHILLDPNKEIDTVVINATSSEWIQGKYDTPADYASQIISGLKLLMSAAEASRGAIVVRKDDRETIEAFESATLDGNPIHVAPLIGKRRIDYYYEDLGTDIVVVSQDPMHGKSLLNLFTYNITGRKVPISCDPSEVGVAVCGVKTSKSVYDAVHDGIPVYDTVVTVSGAVKSPKKIQVKIGTPLKDVIEACGGYSGEPGKLIVNGMITGIAQYTDEVPVTKTTISIYAQRKEEMVIDEARSCLHCARCVDACPVNLVPSRIAILADRGRFDECMDLYVMNCIECGRCAATCPSKLHILQLIRYAKASLTKVYPETMQESENMHSGCLLNGGQ